ncbi:hypothetical protein [Bacteroides oleiciplenus]|uniref:DUF2262 domain-containing protein n=1 Tax=Bacteroides oleiciplenus YIT 12058 TaxID=742727 RepID=K9E482_9BACE|nr:hypothetical protein [Bacteroides oleiciplenus]EKU91488.1 hypothetical protein HMPREF9447_01678 [Bacteroides oleiciplenus YIT 12058]
MKATEIKFDDNFEMGVFSEYLNKEIRLCILDDLEASVEKLTDEYKEKIAYFVNNISQWYSAVCNSIISWSKDTYKIDAHLQDIELMCIFVLFEQNADELFGLGFRVEFDVEHGCGIKIKVNDGKYDIIEVGTGDVAFC